MKMFLFLVMWVPVVASAQTGLLHKVKDKVRARVDQRIDQGIERSLNKSGEGLERQVSSGAAKKSDKKDGTPVAGKGAEAVAPVPALQVYSRYDFVAGERIVYAEDFATDEVGEFPLEWYTNNKGEVVTLSGAGGKWLRLFPGGQFVSPALKSLPENFTAEFDLLLHYNTEEEGYPLPNIQVRLMEILKSDAQARNFLNKGETLSDAVVELSPAGEETSMIEYRSSLGGGTHLSNNWKTLRKLDSYFGKPMHVAIWVQKERFRLWIGGEKVYDIPNAVPAKAAFNRLHFSTEASMYTEAQVGMYVSNFKIAEGAPDLRNKFLTEGKLVTTGILFDVVSDVIRPESYGVLKEIASILKDHPSLKVKITGHTDSDGDDGHNLDLSRRRAAAVRKVLSSEFKIDAGRLQTEGLGETKPVADNNSKEGKFQNRRVEFTRL